MADMLRVVAGDSVARGDAPSADGVPAPGSSKADKQKKRKVRSAWISFVSRILAQLIGAIATVMLGVLALQRYQATGTQLGSAHPVPASAVQAAPPAAVTGRLSVAILPFENYSGDTRHDAFADALTEGVVSELSTLDAVRVVSRTSSMHYRGARKPVPEIGRELAVDLIVEGSFVRDGARLRVITQLIDARRDDHVWAASYLRVARGAVALQTELAHAIATDLGRELRATPQWQAAFPESRNVAPTTGANSQR